LTEQIKDDLYNRVKEALDIIRPNLQADGGDVELLGIEDNIVKVRLQGACHGCPMAAMTLQMGIERIIKQKAPEIEGVENVPEE
jgi:Fe-S cluster biogenesis protein NfuA